MKRPLDFKTSSYFSGTIRLTAIPFLFFGIILIFESLVAGIVVTIGSLIAITTHYRLTIDMSARKFHDYVWVLGFKKGEHGQFETIDYLFIKKKMVSQTISARVASTTIRKDVYDGYLRFSEENKIHLLTSDSKSAVVSLLKTVSATLNIKVIDYTENVPTEL
jgi:hypothetical protein